MCLRFGTVRRGVRSGFADSRSPASLPGQRPPINPLTRVSRADRKISRRPGRSSRRAVSSASTSASEMSSWPPIELISMEVRRASMPVEGEVAGDLFVRRFEALDQVQHFGLNEDRRGDHRAEEGAETGARAALDSLDLLLVAGTDVRDQETTLHAHETLRVRRHRQTEHTGADAERLAEELRLHATLHTYIVDTRLPMETHALPRGNGRADGVPCRRDAA